MSRTFLTSAITNMLQQPSAIADIAAEMLHHTAESYPGIKGNPAPATISDRGQAVVDLLRANSGLFGGNGRTIAKLFGASMGENLEAVYGGDTRESVSGEPGTMVIDSTGTTILVTEAQRGRTSDGAAVELTDANPANYTLPTQEQAVAFIGGYPDKAELALFVLMR